ncbi:hypothetical protein HLB44_13550 [Aquincola sp. S2]|uniref:PEP-CTERM protein-sorting domain-containing protein n=1 Tax=Pseudaquabacterium terrae TaxID=2732868 RepID=A0ABX2EHA6_9BURK|nr:hypothetical protein [Aquabacterium terrae]NRF68013.1 hypothetical protein [Aquabacterium terrae]
MPLSYPTRLSKAILAPLLALGAVLPAQAAPVLVSVPSFSFAAGSGYGVDAAESTGTLLDVLFSSTGFAGASFALDTVGASQTFDVGTVRLREANAHSGIRSAETDLLGLQASITFGAPFAGSLPLLASVSATTGSVSDSDFDLTIAWSPFQLSLADGSVLGIALNTLAFAGAQTLTQSATVTLLQAAPTASAQAVPEPSAGLLAGMALAALALTRRRSPR